MSSEFPSEAKRGADPNASLSIAFVGGFNDSGGGRFAVAKFATGAARLNPGASVRFFPWNGRGRLSAWLRERPSTTAVIGQSLGGYVASRVAVADPGRIERLVTIDPVSPAFALRATKVIWARLRESVGCWIHVVQRRHPVLAFGAHWWGETPVCIADRLISTDFTHGDFFSTIHHLKNIEGVLPERFNWNVPR